VVWFAIAAMYAAELLDVTHVDSAQRPEEVDEAAPVDPKSDPRPLVP
jgi:hypothetical protein